MNFILNNKLATFLIFMIFYCLFNYHLQEGMEGMEEVKIDRATGQAQAATKEDIKAKNDLREKMIKLQKKVSAPGGAMDQAVEKQKVQQAAEKEISHDRKAALSAKTPTQQKKATESSALSRMVESIDGETGKETEEDAARDMGALLDKAPDADSGERAKALGTGGGMAEEARSAAANLSTIAMKDTMKKVAEAQNAAVENLTSSISQSKNLDKKLSGVAQSYGLASQGQGVDGVVGVGSDAAGSTKNSNELIKQRDRIAARFGCEERCKNLYDDETGFLCDSGNCICKINKDKKELLKLPGEAKDDEAIEDGEVTEAFTGNEPSKYVYRIHGKCDTTEIDRGEA